jgi:hypothetical protein
MKFLQEIWKSFSNNYKEVSDDPIGEAAELLEMSRDELVIKLSHSEPSKSELLAQLDISPELYGFIRRAQNTDLRSACANVIGIDEEIFLEYTAWVSKTDSEKLAELVKSPKNVVQLLGYFYNFYSTNKINSEIQDPKHFLEQSKLLTLDLYTRNIKKWSKQQHLNLISEIVTNLMKYYILYYNDEKNSISRSGDNRLSYKK